MNPNLFEMLKYVSVMIMIKHYNHSFNALDTETIKEYEISVNDYSELEFSENTPDSLKPTLICAFIHKFFNDFNLNEFIFNYQNNKYKLYFVGNKICVKNIVD